MPRIYRLIVVRSILISRYSTHGKRLDIKANWRANDRLSVIGGSISRLWDISIRPSIVWAKRCDGFIELSHPDNIPITTRKITRNSQALALLAAGRNFMGFLALGSHQFQSTFAHVDNICHLDCWINFRSPKSFPVGNIYCALHAPLRQPLPCVQNNIVEIDRDLSWISCY